MVWMSPSGMDPIKATLAMFCWAVAWEILDHVSSGPEHVLYIPRCIGITSAYYKLSKNILCSTSTTLCGEFLSRQHGLSTKSHGNVAINLKHYFTEWLLLWMYMCGWVGGWRGRTHRFLLFLSLSAPSWEMPISELPRVYTTACLFILMWLRRKSHLPTLLSSHCFQAHPIL